MAGAVAVVRAGVGGLLIRMRMRLLLATGAAGLGAGNRFRVRVVSGSGTLDVSLVMAGKVFPVEIGVEGVDFELLIRGRCRGAVEV